MDHSQIRTPFTDIFSNIVSHQHGGPCQKIEMNLIDCMEVYGLQRSKEKCPDLYADFKECSVRFKQDARIIAMAKERERQYKSGERSKEDHYADPPAFDSYDRQPKQYY